MSASAKKHFDLKSTDECKPRRGIASVVPPHLALVHLPVPELGIKQSEKREFNERIEGLQKLMLGAVDMELDIGLDAFLTLPMEDQIRAYPSLINRYLNAVSEQLAGGDGLSLTAENGDELGLFIKCEGVIHLVAESPFESISEIWKSIVASMTREIGWHGSHDLCEWLVEGEAQYFDMTVDTIIADLPKIIDALKDENKEALSLLGFNDFDNEPEYLVTRVGWLVCLVEELMSKQLKEPVQSWDVLKESWANCLDQHPEIHGDPRVAAMTSAIDVFAEASPHKLMVDVGDIAFSEHTFVQIEDLSIDMWELIDQHFHYFFETCESGVLEVAQTKDSLAALKKHETLIKSLESICSDKILH